MNYVEPIRDPYKVKQISVYLNQSNKRNYIMFMIGIYSGLRISDILRLTVKDIKNKDSISIRENKTKKQKIFPINNILKKEIKIYCEGKDINEYLIKSRKGKNKSITREMAYKILNDTGNLFGLSSIGTHTMRKTFGYHHYLQNKDVVLLQHIFNHSSPTITLRYIGYEQERINKSIKNFKIF
jgi:integrase